ncbi:MAG: hemolysin family protein [Flavobacteriales bacterium]|jgi:putative hemolysin
MEVLVIFLLTLLNGFFSLSEIALVSVKRARIQGLADRGSGSAKAVLKLLDDPEAFLSSVQVGITLIGIIAGAYGGAALTDDMEIFLSRWPALMPYTHTIALSLVIGSITYFTIVVGELVPKTIALSNPEAIALVCAPIIRVFALITYPIVKLLSVSTSLILKLLPIKENEGERVSEEELRAMIRAANVQGLLDKQETEAHQNLFRFSEQVARTLMTHRSEVEWVDSTKPLEAIIAQVKESTRSKFPVCRGTVDEFEGTLNIRDMLEKLSTPDFRLEQVIRPPVIIPEGASAYSILKLFKKNKQYIALVVDEHGQFEGVLTLHDLTEAIVGDLPDEDDEEEQEIIKRSDGSWLVGGQVLIGDLNQRIGMDIINESETSYATIAGYFLGRFEHIPKPGERLIDERFHGEVIDMDGHRIDKVLITLKEDWTVRKASGTG